MFTFPEGNYKHQSGTDLRNDSIAYKKSLPKIHFVNASYNFLRKDSRDRSGTLEKLGTLEQSRSCETNANSDSPINLITRKAHGSEKFAESSSFHIVGTESSKMREPRAERIRGRSQDCILESQHLASEPKATKQSVHHLPVLLKTLGDLLDQLTAPRTPITVQPHSSFPNYRSIATTIS